MKNKRKYNLLFRTAIFIIILVVLICIMAIGLFYYIFSIPEPYGLSTTDFPKNFTNSFTVWTTYENGELQVEKVGLKRLDEYGLWIQFIDASGEEIFSYNKPEDYPVKYTAAQLLALSTSQYENGNTLFVNSLADTDGECSYIIGFPYDIGKHMLYYNGSRLSRLSPAAKLLIMTGFGILAFSILAYSIWLSRKMSKITEGIRELSVRNYLPVKEKGMFSGIFAALNKVNLDLRRADRLKEETDHARQEWIANITHDLKTPLSPIKGYAELLADDSVKEAQEIREYGRVILKNVNHTEKLINDLKLAYQLEAGSVPYQPKNIRIERCVKEWVIDIINDPVFADRDIAFESDSSDFTVSADADLLRRAVQNLLVNALIHNPADTKVRVTVHRNTENRVGISIQDNGAGIGDAELKGLFDRYYRGTNTKEKPEGSGLGLAIAKQIVVLHGGEITVKSKVNEGAEFTILLPAQN